MFSASKKEGVRFGAVIDIGSGSVGAAIVHSVPTNKHPKLIWSTRERIVPHKDPLEQQKQLTAALLNVFLELGSNGLKALKASHPREKIDNVQVTIAAPNSLTITKSVSAKFDTPTKVTESLLSALAAKAAEHIEEHLGNEFLVNSLHLSILSSSNNGVFLNGYPVANERAASLHAKDIQLNQTLSLTDSRLYKNILEAHSKAFPGTPIKVESFMALYQKVVKLFTKNAKNFLLLDVTAEATELSVIKDGLPSSSRNFRAGQYTIAREIDKATSLTKEESLSLLRDNKINEIALESETKKEQVSMVIKDYEEKLSKLIRDIGGTLALPKQIYLHTDKLTEAFFKERLKNAITMASAGTLVITPVTSELLDQPNIEDTALLLSAYGYHQRLLEDGHG